MPRVLQSRSERPNQIAKARLAEVAAKQWGVISLVQLREIGIGKAVLSAWVEEGRMHRIHPRVYAVGHRSLGIEGRLAAALFYAGKGAALYGLTAGYWLGLIEWEPERIHVVAKRRCLSLPGLRVHHRREFKRVIHNRLPVTPPAETLLGMAAVLRLSPLRRALAEAEFQRLVTLDEVEAVLGCGRPGSTRLRTALECHRPELARTKSALEERFFHLCERSDFLLPDVNVIVAGHLVDAVWFDQQVAVELDGHAAHDTHSAMERDRRRDLDLRAAGYTLLRYTWQQVTETPDLVVADLRRRIPSPRGIPVAI